MLIHLHVKNLALIEDIEVDFGQGLNILTGETGAGKSILLGSLQLILGGRTARDMIREGAPYALVELIFQVENDRAKKALEALEVFPEDGQVVMSRKLMEGRSINRINGEGCTVSQMKAAAACLLDIHGQHEHQSLLYADKQLEILDAYGREKIRPLAEATAESYRRYRKLQKELQSFEMDEEQRNREKAFLDFEVKEIEDARLTIGEDEELEKLYRKLNNGRKIMDALQAVHEHTGSDRGAGEAIGLGVRELLKVTEYDSDLEALANSLQEIDDLLNDFNRELSSYTDELNFDDETFYETEKRLDLINNLKAKYGKSVEQVLDYQAAQQKKLEELDRYEERLAEAQGNLLKAAGELQLFSDKLSKVRKEYSKSLTEKIIAGLRDLNFLDVRFEIAFSQKTDFSANGTDEVEYRISTNPGEPLRPLGKIVSGGELSRIMLAIKAILADRDQVETLIFDEIDTGISGRTAQKVSEKMAVIGRCRQVLCITHLPQIAAMADTHFEIEKHQKGTETITEIHPLAGDESVRELARLLGGSEITQAVYENAKEMKAMAASYKEEKFK